MKHILSFVLALPLLIQAQTTPCIGGFAGEFPCDGWDLVSHLTLAELGATGNGNDSWGWTDPVTGAEYALMGLSNGTAFVNLCDAENPVIVGFLPTHTSNSLWRDVKVYADHAFIVSEAGGHGMQVFDLTELRDVISPPVTFTETAHYDAFGSSHNIVINEESGFAYPVGTILYQGGPVFVNIQDPTNPVAAGGYDADGYTHDAQVVNYNGPDTDWQGKEICFACNADTFTIIDVADKNDPAEISRTGYDQVGYTHQGWLSEDHRYFFIGDEGDENSGIGNTRTIVWDIADLDNPFVTDYHFGTNAAIDHNMYVKDGLIYQANYSSGLRVQQIDESGNPFLTEIGYFDVYPEGDQASFIGAWSCFPYYESGLVIISSMDRGLFVVKPSSTELNVCTPPSALDEEKLDIELSLFPNPADNQVSVSWNKALTARVLVTDTQGRIVYENKLNSAQRFMLDVSEYQSGMYLLHIQSEEGSITRSFSKY
jgi:choice-of-anchor B domain-containing protein